MPLLTFSDLTDGTTPSGESVFNSLYTMSTSALNGNLDALNLSSVNRRVVRHPYLQKGATSGGGMTAGTCSLDYFAHKLEESSDGSADYATQGVYAGVASPQSADDGEFIAIPGASIQFYLPYKAYVLLTWQVTWVGDGGQEGSPCSDVRLFVDGASLGTNHCNVRRVLRTQFPVESSSGTAQRAKNYLRDRYKSRYWSGHQWLPLTKSSEGTSTPLKKGFHSASLRVLQTPEVHQTRIRARSMKFIFFKAQDD